MKVFRYFFMVILLAVASLRGHMQVFQVKPDPFNINSVRFVLILSKKEKRNNLAIVVPILNPVSSSLDFDKKNALYLNPDQVIPFDLIRSIDLREYKLLPIKDQKYKIDQNTENTIKDKLKKMLNLEN